MNAVHRCARGLRAAWALALALVFAPSVATASAFSDVYFFGDSFSDTGNNGPVDAAPGLVTTYGYDADRWTNAGGDMWSEDFAAALGYAAVANTDGGTNYAIGGDRADELLLQVGDFSTDVGGSADSNALYVVVAGGNDLLQGQDAASTVTDVIDVILSLSALGAEKFLVGNLVNFEPLAPGGGPLGPTLPIPANADIWANDFNTGLSTALGGLGGLTIYEWDLAALLDPIITDPIGNGYSQGLNLCADDASCIAGSGTGDFVMHDHVHAMSHIHDQMAVSALAAIPEPSTGLLVGTGLFALGLLRRGRPAP